VIVSIVAFFVIFCHFLCNNSFLSIKLFSFDLKMSAKSDKKPEKSLIKVRINE